MVYATSGPTEIEILLGDGTTWLPLSLAAVYDDKGNDLPRSLSSALAAQNADAPLGEWAEPAVHTSWSRGVGLDYNEAPGVYTRTAGYAMPAGYVTQVTVPAGGTSTPIVAFAEYGGDLWAAEEGNAITGGRVLRLAGGTGAAFVNSTLALGPGEILRDLLVSDDGAGTAVLFASSTDTSGLNGRLHRWNGAAWSSSVVGAYGAWGRNKLKRVFWTTNDGVGAWRIVAISGPSTIAYTLPNADPLQNSATSWVEGVKIVTDTYIDALAASRQHVWVSSKSNVHDLTALGESPELLGYEDRTPVGIPFPVQYFDGYLYRAGGGTLNRIPVDGTPQLEEQPGQCAPGWGTEAETEWRGYPTAFAVDQGYLIVSIWNPTTGRTGIFWGKDKRSFSRGVDVGSDSPNPLIWYGPECFSLGAQRVTALAPSMLASGQRRLWIASLNATNAPVVCWQSLPISGAPIPDLISGGLHRFATGDTTSLWNPTSILRSRPLDWGDANSPKWLHEIAVKYRGADAGTGTMMTVGVGADRPVGTLGYTVLGSAAVDPAQVLSPASIAVAGYMIDYQVQWTSPSGTATPPKVAVLDAIRLTAWRRAPSFRVLQIDVEYGDGVQDLRGGASQAAYSPDEITTLLQSLTSAGRTTLRGPNDTRHTVVVHQSLPVEEKLTHSRPWGKTVTTRLLVAVLGTA